MKALLKRDSQRIEFIKELKKETEKNTEGLKRVTIEELKESLKVNTPKCEVIKNNDKSIIVKMEDGTKRHYKNDAEYKEDYFNIQDYNYMYRIEQYKERERTVNIIIEKVELFVEELKKRSIQEMGLVYNRLTESIIDNNNFWIWFEKNGEIHHNSLDLKVIDKGL